MGWNLAASEGVVVVAHGTTRGVCAREVAASVLMRVQRERAFAAASLDAHLQREVQLGASDRALATQLVYGVLRCQNYLDKRLSKYAKRAIALQVRVHLRVAAYQLLFLTSIPPFAAVSEAVRLVRKSEGAHAAGFANAVLRKLAEATKGAAPVSMERAMWESVPKSLVDKLSESLGGLGEAKKMVQAGPIPPPTSIYVHDGRDVQGWCERLKQAAPSATVERAKLSARGIVLSGAGKMDQLPGFETDWTVQEQGSQLVSLALGAKPGDVVLDACAGRGNKTLILAQQVATAGRVDAADLHEPKLEVLQQRAATAGLAVPTCYPVDWSVGSGEVANGYDRVLIDAPCSGTGTLRRRPELFYDDIDEKLAQLVPLQCAILCRAADRCKSGGRVVYAVCSVLREEGPEIVKKVLSEGAKLEATSFDWVGQPKVFEGQTQVRLLPHEHGTDGYFIASLRKL